MRLHDYYPLFDVYIQNLNHHYLNKHLMMVDEHKMMTMTMVDYVKHVVYYQLNNMFHDLSLILKIWNQDFEVHD